VKIMDVFSAQLEREAEISRRALARVPEGRNDWKPHEKSMPLGYLAMLVASMPSWLAMEILQDELDIAQGQSPEWKTTKDLLAVHEDAVAKGLAAIRGTTEEHLMTPWRLLVAGRTVMEALRHVVVADTFTHLAHHRGQLSVYIRLNDAPVPSIYGPTADEKTFG